MTTCAVMANKVQNPLSLVFKKGIHTTETTANRLKISNKNFTIGYLMFYFIKTINQKSPGNDNRQVLIFCWMKADRESITQSLNLIFFNIPSGILSMCLSLIYSTNISPPSL